MKPNNELQEIAERHNAIIYHRGDYVCAVGRVRHDGIDCQRIRRAAQEARIFSVASKVKEPGETK